MSIFPYLPPLDSKGPFAELSAAGVWLRIGDLDGLASALRVGQDRIRADDVKSIPDAWAQIQGFQSALLDRAQEMHEDVRNQWRGLLALVALQPEFKTVYDLSVARLRLSDQEGPARRFRRVLRDLQPVQALVGGAGSWDRLGILYFQERPLGSRAFAAAKPKVSAALVSPLVLLAAGKSRSALVCEHVPWLAHGLTDPLAVKGLSPRHYAILAKYVERIALHLEARMSPDSEHAAFAALRRELGQFHEDCQKRVAEDYALSEVALDLKWPDPLYAALSQTLVVGEAPPDRSDRRLAVRPEFLEVPGGAGLKGAILIDPDEPDDDAVMVWKNYSLRAARAPTTLARIREEAIAEGWLIVQPSDLFTQDLIRFGEGSTIPAHGQRGFGAALMPLSPLCLLLMSPEDLAQNAVLNEKGDECVVTLDLPLAGAAGRPNSRRHQLIKRYGPEAVQDEDRLDDLAIWPNFRSREWSWTFLRFQYDPEYDLQPRFGVSAEFIAAEAFGGAASLPDRARRLYEWSSDESLIPDQRIFSSRMSRLPATGEPLLMSRLRFAETARLVGELQRLPRGVEAIFFARRTDGRGSERPVGLCLVGLQPVALNGAPPGTIAVDFGTTNSVAYEMHGSTKTVMSFQDRVVFPIRITKNEAEHKADLDQEYTKFFPLRTQDMPFPTVVRRGEYSGDLNADIQRHLRSATVEHGFSDVIFFMAGFRGVARAYFQLLESELLVANIKWGEDQRTRLLVTRFNRQLMMMIAAELLARGHSIADVEWRFSYPQAFSGPKLGQLTNALSQAWTEVFGPGATGDMSSAALDAPTARTQIKMFTESAAAANYFMFDEQKRGAEASNRLMVMLDIGGGTTDVAIWYEKEMRWRSSFRVAGGDFFSRYLTNNREILNTIGFDEVASAMGQDGSSEVTLSFVELFINAPDFASKFNAGFSAFAMEPEGAGLRYCSTAALGGLMYYIGLVLRRLVEEKIVDREDVAEITVAFGGRGSAIFPLFNVGEKYETELTQILRVAVAAALGDDLAKTSRTDSQFSRHPKHEVSRGLLIMGGKMQKPDSVVAPLGESITFDDREGISHTTSADDDVHRLLDAKRVRASGLEEFRRFLVSLRKLTGVAIDIDGRTGNGLRIIQQEATDALRSALAEIKPDDDAPDVQLVEPPFITELRSLIRLMSSPVKERDACLTVTERQ